MQYPARAALACVLGEGKPPSLISALRWVSRARCQPCWRPSLRPLLPFPSLPPQRRASSSLRWFGGCCCPAAHCCCTPSLGTCFWYAPATQGWLCSPLGWDPGRLPQPELSWAAHQPGASRVFHINQLPNSCAGVGASRSRILAPVAIFAFSFPPRAHPRNVSGALGAGSSPRRGSEARVRQPRWFLALCEAARFRGSALTSRPASRVGQLTGTQSALPGPAREAVFGEEPEEDGRRTGAARGWSETRGLPQRPRAARGAGPSPPTRAGGKSLKLARAQGCEDLQLAANILMVG